MRRKARRAQGRACSSMPGVSNLFGYILNKVFGMGMLWLFAGYAEAQQVELLKPKDLGQWNIPSGNYSGITPIGDGRYAVVNDKEARDGFFVFRIVQDERTGQVTDVVNEGFRGVDSALKGGRDAEGVAFVPEDSLVWVSGEADQRVVAYRTDGAPAHRELAVPSSLGRSAVAPNYGFEALGYDRATGLFWTVTENVLKADGRVAEPGAGHGVCLRLQSFGRDGLPRTSYAYPPDMPVSETKGRQYAFGVVAIWPQEGGRLWVMEREINIPKRRLKSRVYVKIYEVAPGSGAALPENTSSERLPGYALKKKPVAAFSTRMRLVRPKLANYEGLCEGSRLADGRRTWLLVSDSQGGYGNRLCHLRDWIRVCVPPKIK